MKVIYLFTLIFLLYSCGPESSEVEEYDYSIINQSGIMVEIIPYVNGIKEVTGKVILQNGQMVNKKYFDYAPYGGFRMFRLFNTSTIGNFTHFEFIFNNSKKSVYEDCSLTNDCNSQPRNIFNNEFNNEKTEIYTITPEDYQNAIDCNGNCN